MRFLGRKRGKIIFGGLFANESGMDEMAFEVRVSGIRERFQHGTRGASGGSKAPSRGG